MNKKIDELELNSKIKISLEEIIKQISNLDNVDEKIEYMKKIYEKIDDLLTGKSNYIKMGLNKEETFDLINYITKLDQKSLGMTYLEYMKMNRVLDKDIKKIKKNKEKFMKLYDISIDDEDIAKDDNINLNHDEMKKLEIDKIKARIEVLQNEIQEDLEEKNELESSSLEQLTKELEKAKKALDTRYEELANDPNIVNDTMIQLDEEYQRLSTQVANIELQINHIQNNKTKESNLENNSLLNQLSKELENAKKALDTRYEELANDPNIVNDTMIQLDEEYQRLSTQVANIELQINHIQNNKTKESNLENNSLLKQLSKELEKAKKALDTKYEELANDPNMVNDTMIQLNEEYHHLARIVEALESQILEIKNNSVRKTENETKKIELKQLKEIVQVYESIFKDAVDLLEKTSNFGDIDEKDQKYFVDRLVDENLKINILKKYENSEKLISELKEEIFNRVKRVKKTSEVEEPQPIIKITNDKKMLFQKSLAGVGGFVTGLGLSCVPGVGTIRMGISAFKLVSSGAKVWSEKYPEGKISKVSKKVTESYNNFKEIHPKFAEGISNIEKKLKDPRVQWFINGIAIGYISGNMIEMISGKTIIDNLKTENQPQTVINNTEPLTSTSENAILDPAANDTPIETNFGSEAPVETNFVSETPVETNFVSETPIEPGISNIELEPGQTYDISALSEGLISSNSDEYLNLISEVGKDAVFDKSVILPDGTEMVHFKQANGLGYAWFKVEDVRSIIEKGMSR